MADYFVAGAGSNTSPYDTWAKAATSLATALAAATTNGDRIILQYNAVPAVDAEVAAATIYTFLADVSLISARNDGGSAFTPTPMGEANWIGNSTLVRSITFAGTVRYYVYGLTVRTAGASSNANIILATSVVGVASISAIFEDCYLWCGNSFSGNARIITNIAGDAVGYMRLRNCTLRFAHAASHILCRGLHLYIDGGSVSSAGVANSPLIVGQDSGPGAVIENCDLSHLTGSLIDDHTDVSKVYRLVNCKLGSGVTILATQTLGLGGAEVYVHDCASGDQHYHFQYHNAHGSLTIDTGIYYTSGGALYDGVNPHTWKIVTNALATYEVPFITPPIAVYHAGTSPITPYLEILREGSATPYKDNQVWAEFSAKTVPGSTIATLWSDLKSLAAGPENQAAGNGLSFWSGESGSAWSGRIDSGLSFTPAAIGHLRARVAVGMSSATVYVDPQIRGLS